MGLVRILVVTLTDLQGHLVDVEAHCASGLPAFTLVGLPDAAVRESRDRVRAALTTCGVTWEEQRLTVNLSPADLPKTGTGLDLALALAVLGACGKLPRGAVAHLERTVHIGELGLDGSLHPARRRWATARSSRPSPARALPSKKWVTAVAWSLVFFSLRAAE